MTWYCIRSATRQEKRAAQSLKELGIATYLPCETRWRRHARVKERETYALLPGYLFADFTAADVSRVLDAEGVHAILGAPRDHGDRGRPVDVTDLVHLAIAEHLGAFNKAPWVPEPTFGVGRQVRIEQGHFTGVLGKISEARGANRVTVLFEWFGRTRKATLSVAELKAA